MWPYKLRELEVFEIDSCKNLLLGYFLKRSRNLKELILNHPHDSELSLRLHPKIKMISLVHFKGHMKFTKTKQELEITNEVGTHEIA